MRNISSFILLLLVILSIFIYFQYKPSVNQQGSIPPVKENYQFWKEFSPPNGGFKVKMPDVPQYVSDYIDDPRTQAHLKYDMYATVDGQGKGYIISVINFPNEKKEEEEALLKGVVEGVLERNKKNKLKYMNMEQSNNIHALSFMVENENQLIRGKAFIQGNVLYVLSLMDKIEAYDHSNFDYFFQSFSVLNSGESNE